MTLSLLARLRASGIELTLNGDGALHVRARPDAITPLIRQVIEANMAVLVGDLRQQSATPDKFTTSMITPDAEQADLDLGKVQLLRELCRLGVAVSVADRTLAVKAPSSVMSEVQRSWFSRHHDALIRILGEGRKR
jgi:hypothetical protein